MGKISGKIWLLAYLVGVGLCSAGITIACTFGANGSFQESPSAYYGAWGDAECAQAYGVPRCGYFICSSGGFCASTSQVNGCTAADDSEMWQYMLMGCQEGCAG